MDKKMKNYIDGVRWLLGGLLISCGNDVITKYLGREVGIWQLVFLRFFFGVVTLYPLCCYRKIDLGRGRWRMHFVRAVLLLLAMCCWVYGTSCVVLATTTVMSFTIPIFTLILARVLLKERVSWSLWGAVGIGLSSTIWMHMGGLEGRGSLYFIPAALFFAWLDIINKRYVEREPMIYMLLCGNGIAALFLLPVALYSWQPLCGCDWLLCCMLGLGGNLLLYFLLKAFSLVPLAQLAPLRYLELPLSLLLGYLLFGEQVDVHSLVAAFMIIGSTAFILRQHK